MFKQFPFFKQLDSMDCGPACLRMVARFYGKNYSLSFLRDKCYIGKVGVTLKGIIEGAESIGFRTLALRVTVTKRNETPSLSELPLPAIIHWNQNHFVVVYKVSNNKIWIADPASGKTSLTIPEFSEFFCGEKETGIALVLEVSPEFHQTELDNEIPKGLHFLFRYVEPHKRLIFQMLIGVLLGTIFQLIFPFLTQSLVDIGIDSHNLNFIHLILIAQLMLFISQTFVRFIQNWILLHVSIRINVNIVGDFLVKLMKMPISFFDSKNTGDLLQRISDHERIESFLTNSSLSVVLSFTNMVVFGIVLAIYSIPIFIVFALSALLYVVWISFFLRKRKEMDYKAFQQLSEGQDSLIEIIQGMSEIKLQGSHLKRKWNWSVVQAKLFAIKMKSLAISQAQDGGALFIVQLKDIIITFMSAKSVIEGQITLGMMLAIQYIIGQLNSPLLQFVSFIRSTQDASISLERLSEVHKSPNEENVGDQKVKNVPDGDIAIEKLSFKYSPISPYALEDISFRILRGKTTAIVGSSGSGKTTLIKILLKFYEPTQGTISVGDTRLNHISQSVWRDNCGVVMQDGFIFSDSILNNISESSEYPDHNKALKSIEIANIIDFVSSQPLGLNTRIGAKGNAMSQGQKQRLLIARAIYKDPEFLFFDEATNALDATNEKIILNNLNGFLKGKTSVIVAHRLSTVKSADQIIVLHKGRIVEIGKHEELVKNKGSYFKLVKDQLELGV